MRTASTGRRDMRDFIAAAVLSALIIVMTVVPYTGYIYYGLIEITTLHIVVAIGAVMLGWKYGAWLGFVWGATCVIRAFTNPLWAPFTNPLVSLVPRVIVGIVCGWTAQKLRKAKCKPFAVGAFSAAAAACPRRAAAAKGRMRICPRPYLRPELQRAAARHGCPLPKRPAKARPRPPRRADRSPGSARSPPAICAAGPP